MYMNVTYLFCMIIVLCSSCKEASEKSMDTQTGQSSLSSFDSDKWQIYEKGSYPFREEMLDPILYTDTIRQLKKDQITKLLGEPSYLLEDSSFLYYTISKNRLGPMTLGSRTLVIKLSDDSGVEWIKLHE